MARRNTGPDKATVALVLERDGDRCVVCGFLIYGTRGLDWSLQHRISRGMGGSRLDSINSPANLLTVHGHGTAGCHGRIEAAPEIASHFGYRLLRGSDATRQPVWIAYPPEQADGLDWDTWPAPGEYMYLDDSGGCSASEPGVES